MCSSAVRKNAGKKVNPPQLMTSERYWLNWCLLCGCPLNWSCQLGNHPYMVMGNFQLSCTQNTYT